MVMPLRHVNREQFKKLYLEGKSPRDLATLFDVSYTSLHTLAHQMGIARTKKEAYVLLIGDKRFKKMKGVKRRKP